MRTVYIHGGTVIDPSQEMECRADVVCIDGKVSEIIVVPSEEQTAVWIEKADLSIDAKGKIVTPGFIDIHMHEDDYDPETDTLERNITKRMVLMGVTTAVGGNCGSNNAAPDIYLDAVDRHGTATNLALMVGHTFLRHQCGGHDKYAPVDDGVIEEMKRLGEKYLDVGCFGVSFGVKYIPGTRWEEIIELAKLCRKDDKIVSSHVRNDVDGVFEACEELAAIGREAGVKVQFSHIGSMGGYGQMAQLLEQIEGYHAEKIDMMCDCYPYDAFSTEIGATTYDAENFAAYNSDYSHILLCDGPYAGQRCTKELFDEMRAVRPDTMTVGYFMKQEEVDMALAKPYVMLGSDGILVGNQGHPRAAGAFPRFLRQYAAEGKMPLSECIAKVTTMAAKRLKLTQKGSLKPGCDADIVIFDLGRVEDCATYTEPVLPPRGIDWVLIGGEIAVKGGQLIRDDLGCSVRA